MAGLNLGDLAKLGWREWVGLPDLGIGQIKAKVDTGARTSALHAFELEPFFKNDEHWVRFSIHPIQRDTQSKVVCEARVVDQRSVRDSGGHEELRYVIETRVVLGEDSMKVEMTLTNRDDMRFRVLLGRTTLRNRYLVDSGRSYLRGRKRRKKSKSALESEE